MSKHLDPVTVLFCPSHFPDIYRYDYISKKYGLPMGSPLNGVLAFIYLELLEMGSFKYIIPNTACYFRYIDNLKFIYLQ